MKHISILVPQNSVLQAIADPQYCFNVVNEFMVSAGNEPVFKVELVGAKHQIKLNNGSFAVFTDRLINDVDETDLIIIPALFGDMNAAVDANKDLTEWILKMHKNGAEVASLCVGAFLLAETGLLNHKKCSTHWGFYNQFKNMYPLVDVQDGCIVTEEHKIYTSGGANSYWNLLLHLVEKYTNRATAVLISKYFAIDISRNSQSVFTIFNGQKNHDDNEINKAQAYIEQHFEAKFTVDDLAGKLALGRRSFERRFKQATNNTVMEYIQRVKIEAAKRILENSQKNITDVMYEVGYTDVKSFRSTFKKITGLSPLDYKNKYCNVGVGVG